MAWLDGMDGGQRDTTARHPIPLTETPNDRSENPSTQEAAASSVVK
jgi:hypothetical protein